MSSTIGLTETERMELSHRATSRSGRADDGRRARLILLLEAGHTWAQIRHKLDCNDAFIARWSKRFGRERLAGLFSRHAGHGPSKLTPALEARIQALDRKDPVLPLSPGRAERHGFEYYRHGTLSLYAAFNTKTGEVLGKTAARHTSAEFVAFLTDIVVNQPATQEIHVIADNLSAHKTKQVSEFLDRHANVHLHFTPTYSSWLNQVELWFARIERDVIARGVFTSVPDLRRRLMRYIRQYNKAPRTIKWRYRDPTRRITLD